MKANTLNSDYKRELLGPTTDSQTVFYACLIIGKETLVFNDKTGLANQYLEDLLSFLFEVKDRAGATIIGTRRRLSRRQRDSSSTNGQVVNGNLNLPLDLNIGSSPNPKTDLVAFFKTRGLEVIDHRPDGGSLWVVGDVEMSGHMKELAAQGIVMAFTKKGSKSTGFRPAWYTRPV